MFDQRLTNFVFDFLDEDWQFSSEFNALFNMLIAAFSSLSRNVPHLGQECVLTDKVLGTFWPQFEQFCDVWFGLTLITWTPRLTATAFNFSIKAPQATS